MCLDNKNLNCALKRPLHRTQKLVESHLISPAHQCSAKWTPEMAIGGSDWTKKAQSLLCQTSLLVEISVSSSTIWSCCLTRYHPPTHGFKAGMLFWVYRYPRWCQRLQQRKGGTWPEFSECYEGGTRRRTRGQQPDMNHSPYWNPFLWHGLPAAGWIVAWPRSHRSHWLSANARECNRTAGVLEHRYVHVIVGAPLLTSHSNTVRIWSNMPSLPGLQHTRKSSSRSRSWYATLVYFDPNRKYKDYVYGRC